MHDTKTPAAPSAVTPAVASRPAQRAGHATTANLLKAGMVAGALYTAVSAAQAALRDGFDARRHAWSLLTNGDLGWIQTVNFAVTGALVIAAAVGLRRALSHSSRGAQGAKWVGRLLAVHGAGLIAAGVFRPDPALGFPPGTPEVPGPISWHGLVHFAAGGIGFACFVAACLVMARRFTGRGARGWATYSRTTAVIFLAAFVGIASGSAGPTTLVFLGAVLLSWVWLALLCRKTIREL